MALDLEAIERELQAVEARKKLLEDIKRLAANPEAQEMLEKLVRNGNRDADVDDPPDQIEPYSGLSQIDAVRRAIQRRNGRFVVGEIGDELRSGGMHISNIAVGRVLRRLDGNGEIRVALEGGGNVPNQYETTQTFRISLP